MTTTLDKARRVKELRAELQDRRLSGWEHDPVKFVTDCIPSLELADYQANELTALATHGREAVRGPRGSGKTMPAALAFWWFVCTSELMGQDWKAPTTAGSWDQVKNYLWPEIHKWHRRINWETVGLKPPRRERELLKFGLTMNYGEGFGKATDDPDLIEGAHASRLLFIIDEGKAVVDGIWDAGEGFFSSPGTYYLFALSTPGAPVGRFYDIHARRPGFEDWHVTHVTIDDAISAGRITEEWRAQRERQWGQDSMLYRCHVLAEFAGEEDGVIPLAWVEAAVDRWREKEWSDARPERIGVDVADTGDDETVFAYRQGPDVYRLEFFTDGDVALHADRAAARAVRNTLVVVDSIGVGAGTLANLNRVDTLKATGFVASRGSKRRDKTGTFGFNNLRSAAWWNLRELLDPDNGHNIALPDDARLMGDLTAPTWRELAGGKVGVESKDKIRQRLGRSTDAGDAVVMVLWDDTTTKIRGSFKSDLTRTSPAADV